MAIAKGHAAVAAEGKETETAVRMERTAGTVLEAGHLLRSLV